MYKNNMSRGKYNPSEDKLQRMEATKEAIVNAAFAEFARQGYENASIAEIARAAGTGKGTLYNYFDSKQKLYAEIAWRIMQKLESAVHDNLIACRCGRDKVNALGRTLYTFFRENRFYYEVFSFLNSNIMNIVKNDPRFARDITADPTVKFIEEGKLDGSISPDVHPVKFIAFASSTIWGMLMYMHERGDSVLERTGLPENEMVDYSFTAMEKMLID